MFGLPIKDAIYGFAILALLIGFGVFVKHERDIGQQHELAALQASSTKLQAAANAQVAQLTTQHTAEVAKITETYENQHTADSLQHDSDAQRLRNFDAYRSSHGAVQGPSTGPAAVAGGGSLASADAERLTSLEQVALDLATAGRSVSDSLSACTAERSSLTGK